MASLQVLQIETDEPWELGMMRPDTAIGLDDHVRLRCQDGLVLAGSTIYPFTASRATRS